MATHKSALKRHRQSLARRSRNRTDRSRLKTAVKSLLKTIEDKDSDKIQDALRHTTSVIAQSASKGLIHKNTAGRKISRLTKKARAVLQASG